MGELKRKVLELARGAHRSGPFCHPARKSGAGRLVPRRQPLLDALHDVYLQGVHIRSLVLALGATEVRRLLGGASPLVGQGQVKGGVSWRKRGGGRKY